MSSPFRLKSEYEPKGDQPAAIEKLVHGLTTSVKYQTLLGITGSGKTFTMANVIQRIGKPTLIMAPNKTLAAQLYGEMRELFPTNAVAYFVSYYDYYQPEAYLPTSDTFIEKDAIINDQIDRMRHAATHALLSRSDTIIVASVSCIYGIGSSDSYEGLQINLVKGETFARDALLLKLVDIQYERNDIDFHRGTFRVRGDVVEIFPAYEENLAIRVEFFGDEIDEISEVDPLRGKVIKRLSKYSVYPGSHYVTPKENLGRAIGLIRDELRERMDFYDREGRFVEKQRIAQRTSYDLEMLEQMGFVQGIENYSRHLSTRKAGEPAPTLIDYFPDDFLLIMDESHQTVPQVSSMYRGDRARKENLVEYGFRLPSAMDNRPLQFHEFEKYMNNTVFVSATPGDFEMQKSGDAVVEQLIRPTGLLDPEIEVRPVGGQIDDLLIEIRKRIAVDERVLVTTLTKRMSEDLTEYYSELGIKVRYLHSDVETMERVEILKDLRAGVFDVLVGINLLREGLDLPEVSLVAILDSDKEGFLRSPRALIQTIGRAARNSNGRVFMYADRITRAMEYAISETYRRRAIQAEYNTKHGISPATVKRTIKDMSAAGGEADYYSVPKRKKGDEQKASASARKSRPPSADSTPPRASEPPGARRNSSPAQAPEDLAEKIEELRSLMFAAAENLEFETAARLRDQLNRIQSEGGDSPSEAPPPPESKGKASTGRSSSRPANKKSGAQRKLGSTPSDIPDSSTGS
jgi:excinuclease ABC subunit B